MGERTVSSVESGRVSEKISESRDSTSSLVWITDVRRH